MLHTPQNTHWPQLSLSHVQSSYITSHFWNISVDFILKNSLLLVANGPWQMKLFQRFDLSGPCVCVLEGGSVEKSGWAVIYVTRNDVMRTICLWDKDKCWSYLRKMEREVKCSEYITSEIHNKITSSQCSHLFYVSWDTKTLLLIS